MILGNIANLNRVKLSGHIIYSTLKNMRRTVIALVTEQKAKLHSGSDSKDTNLKHKLTSYEKIIEKNDRVR